MIVDSSVKGERDVLQSSSLRSFLNIFKRHQRKKLSVKGWGLNVAGCRFGVRPSQARLLATNRARELKKYSQEGGLLQGWRMAKCPPRSNLITYADT